MKKLILILTLGIFSCGEIPKDPIISPKTIKAKKESVKSSYDWILESYKAETVYYIFTTDGYYSEISMQEYMSLEVGDQVKLKYWQK